jgi:invasion protein IalB
MSLRALILALLLALAPVAAFAARPAQQVTPPASPAIPPVATQAPAPAQTGLVLEAQETHGDWRVVCASPNNQKVCVFSQQLSDKSSGKTVLGIEVRAAADDRLTASIVMPFGVAVDKPVTIRVDEATPMTVPFKTCIPMGCVVTTTWESSTVAALRKGTAMYVSTLSADTGQAISFRISLAGFGSALDRSIVLSKP